MNSNSPEAVLHLEQFLPYRLSVLANTLSASLAGLYAPQYGLTPPEWRVIAVLAQHPGLTAAGVVARTAMDKVAVSRAVARLLRQGRLSRRRSTDDRRCTSLELTRVGQALYRDVAPRALAYERDLLQILPRAEQARLNSILELLTRRARKLHDGRIIEATQDPG